MGGYFYDSDSSGYAYVGYGDAGIYARGNSYGGYFNDINNGDYAYIGYNGYSLYGNGRLYTSDTACGAGWILGGYYGSGGDYVRIFGDGWLDITGNAQKPGGGAWLVLSDARLKNVDGSYEKGLDEIIALEPVNYHYKDNNGRGYDASIGYVGLVAQDVQPIFPEAVTEGRDGYLELDTSSINFAVINAIKELKAEKDALQEVVCELKPDADVCD